MPSWFDHSTQPNFQRSDLLQRSSTSDSTIPEQLQAAIPDCARPCVSNWITTQYFQTCRDSSCLCDSYSYDSYALGEIAFICAMSEDCAGRIDDESAGSAYAVCSAEPDAVPRTHTTLTTTVNGPAPQSTSSKASPTTSATSQTASMTLTGSRAISSTVATATSNPATGATLSPAADATSGAATSKTTLTSGQAVGISIGAVAGVVIVVCIVYLLACMRRRKAKREQASRQSYDFVDEGSSRYSHFDSGASNLHKLPSEKHNTVWPSLHYQSHDAAGRQTSGDYAGSSCFSQRNRVSLQRDFQTFDGTSQGNASTRTVSKLLPERPGSKPPSPRATMPRSRSPQLIQTPATVFEEEHRSILPHALVPGLPAHPAVLKIRQPQSHMAQPTLTLEIPEQKSVVDDTGNWPLPPPRALVNNQDRLSGRSGARSSKTSLLDYYASSDSGASPQVLDSPTPIEEATQVRRPAPAAIVVCQPSYLPKAVRDSFASDTSRRTSFESNIPEELTPPEEDEKRLSPVAESPISNVRYPRIPRSSNQAVPRSPVYSALPSVRIVSPDHHNSRYSDPKQQPSQQRRKLGNEASPSSDWRGHSPSLSSSSLAAKRRGDSAAHVLEQGLRITNSSQSHSRKNSEHQRPNGTARQEGALNGYGKPVVRIKSSNPAPNYPLTIQLKSPVDSLKSPLWNGKFTPTRRGDDLYLSVEKAPRESRYHEVYD